MTMAMFDRGSDPRLDEASRIHVPRPRTVPSHEIFTFWAPPRRLHSGPCNSSSTVMASATSRQRVTWLRLAAMGRRFARFRRRCRRRVKPCSRCGFRARSVRLAMPSISPILMTRLQAARRISVRPLKAEATLVAGGTVTAFGINEIVVSRQALQAAKLCVKTDGMSGYREVVGDGLLVATPVGSTGYNRSAGGPTLPLNSQLVALTGIAVHRPSEWSNLVLSNQLAIEVEVTDPAYRAVRVETCFQEIPDISSGQNLIGSRALRHIVA